MPALAVGHFHEQPAKQPLHDSFACLWIHRIPEMRQPLIVIPDATIDLQWVDGMFRVAGPDRDPQIEHVSPGSAVVGFRFKPAAASAWLGVPAHEIAGQRLALCDLWGNKARRMAEEVHLQLRTSDLVTALQAVVANRSASLPVDMPMRAAYGLIRQGPAPGTPLLPWLSRALAMSERTLRRRFDESYGYGPKALDRILRYQRFLSLARASRAKNSAALAIEAGYADQAHLIRESQRLTGNTPVEFKRMTDNGSITAPF
jgi:AraC-like DNA-binding protein